MANKDLRDWIDELQLAGQLQRVIGADHHEEIGAIVDIHMHKMTNPAVLFEEIPGFPKEHKVQRGDTVSGRPKRCNENFPRIYKPVFEYLLNSLERGPLTSGLTSTLM